MSESGDRNPPAEMVEVSKDEFFRHIADTPGDPMPSNKEREFTTWETRTRRVVGWSVPGWANPGVPHRYAITK